MDVRIRPVTEADVDAVVALSLLAWKPVDASFRQIMGENIYTQVYPDWAAQQSAGVAAACRDATMKVWIAEADGVVVGFVACIIPIDPAHDEGNTTGEVDYLAVHPAYQNRGIGAQLNDFALERFKEAGLTLAVVGTGGDPGHAPARRSYEKAGYTALPLVRYYKAL